MNLKIVINIHSVIVKSNDYRNDINSLNRVSIESNRVEYEVCEIHISEAQGYNLLYMI